MNDSTNNSHENTGQQATPAGWYPDGQGAMRWWDGYQWTEHVTPAVTQAQVPAQAQAEAPTQTTVPAYGMAQGSQMPAAKPKSKLLVPLIVVGALVVVGATGGTIALMNSAFNKASENISSLDPVPVPPVEDAPSTTAPEDEVVDEDETDYSAGAIADRFVERDQFFRDQQLPLDGSLLTAQTAEQKEFVKVMKDEFESKGAGWGATEESLVLALTGDACETSIMNGHKVNETLVLTHAMTSPLVAQVTAGQEETDRVRNTDTLMRIVVIGTEYMCPADASQWAEGYETINGAW